MNPSSTIKQQIEDTFLFNLNEEETLKGYEYEDDDKDIEGTVNAELKTYNAVQMASVEISKIDSIEVLAKEKPDSYSYYIDDLDTNFKDIKRNKIKINLCLYSVSFSEYKPFIQYLLYKYTHSSKEILSFPFFIYRTGDVESEIAKTLNKITSEVYIIKGYKKFNNEIYVVVSLPDNACVLQEIKSSDKWWFSLLSEIINEGKIMYFPIHNNVRKFFSNNTSLLYILDHDNVPYESPLALYSGQPKDKTNFIAKFGIAKSSPLASMGPFYYFGTYELASKFASWSYNYKPLMLDDILITDNEFGRYKEGGVVRFAVFTGKVKVFMNREFDPNDDSQLAAHRDKREQKIIDINGDWTNIFDSTCVSEILFRNGQYNHLGAQYCIKNYYQQQSLSYHSIDKKSLSAMWKPDTLIKII